MANLVTLALSGAEAEKVLWLMSMPMRGHVCALGPPITPIRWAANRSPALLAWRVLPVFQGWMEQHLQCRWVGGGAMPRGAGRQLTPSTARMGPRCATSGGACLLEAGRAAGLLIGTKW